MQPTDAILHHLAGFVADLLVYLLLAQLHAGHSAEQLSDLSSQQFHARAHRR